MAEVEGFQPTQADELFISPSCPIAITGYQIRNPDIKKTYFSRGPALGQQIGECQAIPEIPAELGILYVLPRDFLKSKTIASQVLFANITEQPLENMKLVETHYLQRRKLQQFQFELNFVPPRTCNAWEHIYQPEFKQDKKFEADAIKGPWDVETKMYVGEELVMFTRAQLTFE